jgi:hypothetical protein
MQPLDSAEVAKQLAGLVRRFHASFEAQQKRDTETIASLVRVMRNPRGAARVHVDQFFKLLSAMTEDDQNVVSRDGQQGRPTEA